MASSGRALPAAPAPPGHAHNFVNGETKTGSNIALHTIMLFFVTVSVGVRLYTRHFITRQLGTDDCLCIFAFCLIIVYSALLLACGEYSLGHHLWDTTFDDFVYGNKLQIVAESIYLAISATIKLSCLVFYRRLFGPSAGMKGIIYAAFFFISMAYTALLVTTNLYCQPIAKHWNPAIEGHCLPSGSLAYISGAFNVASDVFVVCLPLPAVWRLNMRLSRKIKVMSVFSLGIVVVTMSVTRLGKTPSLFNKRIDYTWELSNLAIYSILELYIGMICSCLLAFPAFVDRYGTSLISRIRSYSNLRRSTDRDTSGPPSEEDVQANRQRKIFIYGSVEDEKLGDNNISQEPFYNTNATHRARLGSEEATQSPQGLETAQVV